MPRQRLTYPCSKCAVSFLLNPLQAARVRKNPNAPVYCGRRCAGVEKAKPLPCAFCGESFEANPEQRRLARHGHLIYCSHEHYQQSRVTFTCEGCRAVFVTTPYERKLFSGGGKVRCAACRKGKA